MVVFANERGWRGQSEGQIAEGAAVREKQILVRLPDLSRMQVKAAIHESKISMIRAGMPARVILNGKELKGVVDMVDF